MVQHACCQIETINIIASARHHAGRDMSKKVVSNVLSKGRRHIKGTMLHSCLGLA